MQSQESDFVPALGICRECCQDCSMKRCAGRSIIRFIPMELCEREPWSLFVNKTPKVAREAPIRLVQRVQGWKVFPNLRDNDQFLNGFINKRIMSSITHLILRNVRWNLSNINSVAACSFQFAGSFRGNFCNKARLQDTVQFESSASNIASKLTIIVDFPSEKEQECDKYGQDKEVRGGDDKPSCNSGNGPKKGNCHVFKH